MKNRGACFCESSHFICEQPEEMPELYPGLYMMAGYSETDVEMLRKEVPSATLEKAGFMSAEPAKDIGSRLQMALERLQPEVSLPFLCDIFFSVITMSISSPDRALRTRSRILPSRMAWTERAF